MLGHIPSIDVKVQPMESHLGMDIGISGGDMEKRLALARKNLINMDLTSGKSPNPILTIMARFSPSYTKSKSSSRVCLTSSSRVSRSNSSLTLGSDARTSL